MFTGAWSFFSGVLDTQCLRKLCPTRKEAVQAMWALFVELGWWARDDAITFWEHLFDDEDSVFDANEVYMMCMSSTHSPCDDTPLIRLVRRLMPLDWYTHLKESAATIRLDDPEREQINADYAAHLKSVELTEAELHLIVDELSEASMSREIQISFQIVEIQVSTIKRNGLSEMSRPVMRKTRKTQKTLNTLNTLKTLKTEKDF